MEESVKIKKSLAEKKCGEYKSNRRFVVWAVILSYIVLVFFYYSVFVFVNVVVEGASMETTLHNGDVVIANKTRSPEAGDVVILENILPNGKWIIKRVIAVEGDVFKIQDGEVFLNGNKIDEPYAHGSTRILSHAYPEESCRFYEGVEYTVPENMFFYLGDNRENSSDGRYFWFASVENVVGVVENWSIKTKEFRNGVYDFFNIDRGVKG